MQCIDMSGCSLKTWRGKGFTTMGETAVPRQILPGRLRVINHKKAKLAPFSRRRDHHDAHLWTERHHAWIACQSHAANQFDRFLAAGNAVDA
jgi:hypothetical protein